MLVNEHARASGVAEGDDTKKGCGDELDPRGGVTWVYPSHRQASSCVKTIDASFLRKGFKNHIHLGEEFDLLWR